MSIKELRKLTGLSQKDFGSRYDIPHRTIQSWETEQRSCPEYVENLLERVVLEDCGKKVGYVFSWMTEHAGDDKFFSSKSEAMKEAGKAWEYATKSERKEYVRFEVFKIICTAKEWDELIESYISKAILTRRPGTISMSCTVRIRDRQAALTAKLKQLLCMYRWSRHKCQASR